MSSKQRWSDLACRRGEELRAMKAELEAAKALNAALVDALRALRTGPVFHCVPEDHEKHWPQIASADAMLSRLPN